MRLMHLENQAKELVEYEARKAAGETEEEEDPAANSTLNSCVLLQCLPCSSLSASLKILLW